MVGWLAGLITCRHVGVLICGRAYLVACWLACWVAGWRAGTRACLLVCLLPRRQTRWSAERPIGWLAVVTPFPPTIETMRPFAHTLVSAGSLTRPVFQLAPTTTYQEMSHAGGKVLELNLLRVLNAMAPKPKSGIVGHVFPSNWVCRDGGMDFVR